MLRIKIINESEEPNMKKHLSMLLVTLLVIMAFAAVAAARVEVCPQCNQGTMGNTWSDIDNEHYDVRCSHGLVGWDYITRTYRVYYSGCSNCSNYEEVRRVMLSETVSCNGSSVLP